MFAEALDDNDPFVRRQAAGALGDLADPRCRPVLAALLSDADNDIRYEAITGLQEIREPSLLPALRERAHDTDPFVRRAAVSALRDVDLDGSRELLRALAAKDTDGDVRVATVEVV